MRKARELSEALIRQDATLAIVESMLEHIAHPVFVKDRAHRWVLINNAFCELVGAPREQLLGKTDHDFFPKIQADAFHEKDREVFKRGVTIAVDEEPITDAQLRSHYLATVKVPVFNNDEVTHIIGFIHDITHHKEAEEALRTVNEALEGRVRERTDELKRAQQALVRKERLTVLGQLSGGLAHQIRNPLASISNAATILKKKSKDLDEEAQLALSILHEEVWEADRIITDLLDFARVRPPSRAPVAVAELIDAALLRGRSGERVSIRREIDDSLRVLVDSRQTRDALGNLFRNAIEAMDEEGTLTITALRARGESEAQITIADTGTGLAPEALQHLFEPLRTSKPLGLGLGLSTAKTLIENQEGSIRLRSSSPTGTVFEVRLPLGE